MPENERVASTSKARTPPPSIPPPQPVTQSLPPPQASPVPLPSTPPPAPPAADDIFDDSEPQLARASASADFAPLEIADVVLGETSPPLTMRLLCAALRHVAPTRGAAWWRQRALDEEEEIRKWRADIEREKAQMMGTLAVGLSASTWGAGGQAEQVQAQAPEAPVKKSAGSAKAKGKAAKAASKNAKASTSAQTKRKGKAKATVDNATASSIAVAVPPSQPKINEEHLPSQQISDAFPPQTPQLPQSQAVYAPQPSHSPPPIHDLPQPHFAPLAFSSNPALHVLQRPDEVLAQAPLYPFAAMSQGNLLDQQYLEAAVSLHVQTPDPQPEYHSSLHSPIADPSLPAAPPDFSMAFGEPRGQGNDGVLGMSFAAPGSEMIDMRFGGEQAEQDLGAGAMPMTTIDPALLGGGPPAPGPPASVSDRPTSPSERHRSPLLGAAESESASERSRSPSVPLRERTSEPSSERTLAGTDDPEFGEKTGGKGRGKGKGKGKEKANGGARGVGKGKGKGKTAGREKAGREVVGGEPAVQAGYEILQDAEMTSCHHCRRATTQPKMRCVEMKPNGEPCGKRFCVNCIFKASVPVSFGSCSDGCADELFLFLLGMRSYKDIEFNAYATNFHCPYCRQTCLCTVCCTKRGVPYVPMPRGQVVLRTTSWGSVDVMPTTNDMPTTKRKRKNYAKVLEIAEPRRRSRCRVAHVARPSVRLTVLSSLVSVSLSAPPQRRSPSPPRPLPENHAQELKSGLYWGSAYAVGGGAPIGGAYINWDLHSVVLKPVSVSVSAAAGPRRRVFCGAPDPSWELAPVAELGDPGYVPPPKGAPAYVGRRLQDWEREKWETPSDVDVEQSCFEGPLTPTSSDIEEDAPVRIPSQEHLHFVIAKVLAETGAGQEDVGPSETVISVP